MSVRTLRTLRRRRREQRLQSVKAGETTRQEDNEAQDRDYLQLLSQCPACNQDRDSVLILPCSHILCGPCVAAGEGLKSGRCRRGNGGGVCSVLCPSCGRHVELPCWDWSSVTSCLPQYPQLSPVLGSERHSLHVQEETSCTDTSQSLLHGTNAASSSALPADGAVDLQEAEMEKSVYGLCFALDPSSISPNLRLSNSSLTVSYHGSTSDILVKRSKTFDPQVASDLPQVWADVVIKRGQYYWEVDVCNSSVYRIGVTSLDGSCGWWFERQGPSYSTVYDGSREPLCSVPPQLKTLGVFLNVGGGALCFHNPLTQEHLATLPTRFPADGAVPALSLGQGRLRLRCGLPPPPHVFLSKDSAYRGPCAAGGGRWRREVPFQSVRKVIQKFEELVVSDSDSGLVSGFGSSCSTLASLADLGIPGPVPSGQAGLETGLK